jgi:hypothetical protein
MRLFLSEVDPNLTLEKTSKFTYSEAFAGEAFLAKIDNTKFVRTRPSPESAGQPQKKLNPRSRSKFTGEGAAFICGHLGV